MVRIALYFFSLIFSVSALSLEHVSASIDANPVIQGESFILEIVADDEVSISAFDSSSLLQDFIVGRTSTTTGTRMVNGSTTRETRWSTVLVPKKLGKIIIPAFDIENKKTAPIAVVVIEPSNKEAQQQRDIYITSEISSKEVYVQQQLTLKIKLYVGVALEGGSLSDPTMPETNVAKLGQDSQKEELINGRRFQVIERTFAISPQKSGEFSLEMPIFSGQVSMPSQRRSGLFGFNQSKPVSVIADPITITVKPKPQSYQGQWLPSELLTLHEEWQPEPSSFMVGEPITRTITMNVAGATKEQLPQINMPDTKGLKIYPDQPVFHSGLNSNRLVSQSVTNFAVVATYAGDFELPEIIIPWWNTVTNRQEFATLPAKKITIKPNPDMVLNAQAPAQPSSDQELLLSDNSTAPMVIQQASWLQWLFLTLWLLTSFLWAVSYFIQKKSTNKTKSAVPVNQPYLALLKACKENNGQQVLSLLIPWLSTLYPTHKITNLAQALSLVNQPPLTDAVNNLQASYYAKETNSWQGQQLLSVIQTLHKSQFKQAELQNISLNP